MARNEWSSEELRASVLAYLKMLDLEKLGEKFTKRRIVDQLTSGALSSRTRGSVEHRFQNISSVMKEMGLPWVNGYKPLSHVGTNIHKRIKEIVEKERQEKPADEHFGNNETSMDLNKPKILNKPTAGPAPRKNGYIVVAETNDAEGRVYIARFGKTNCYKIGFSINPSGRIQEFNKHIPHSEFPDLPIWLNVFETRAMTKDDAFELEQKTLAELFQYRTVGERVICKKNHIDRVIFKLSEI